MPGPTITLSVGPANEPYTVVYDYGGGSAITYIGKARSWRPSVPLTVTSISAANPAVVTVTAHGLGTDNTVVIAGGTGDWAGINGTQVITVTGADTFTIPVNTSAYSGTFAGTVTTNCPQTSKPIWSIKKFYYNNSSAVTREANAAGTTTESQIWDNIATLSYI